MFSWAPLWEPRLIWMWSCSTKWDASLDAFSFGTCNKYKKVCVVYFFPSVCYNFAVRGFDVLYVLIFFHVSEVNGCKLGSGNVVKWKPDQLSGQERSSLYSEHSEGSYSTLEASKYLIRIIFHFQVSFPVKAGTVYFFMLVPMSIT